MHTFFYPQAPLNDYLELDSRGRQRATISQYSPPSTPPPSHLNTSNDHQTGRHHHPDTQASLMHRSSGSSNNSGLRLETTCLEPWVCLFIIVSYFYFYYTNDQLRIVYEWRWQGWPRSSGIRQAREMTAGDKQEFKTCMFFLLLFYYYYDNEYFKIDLQWMKMTLAGAAGLETDAFRGPWYFSSFLIQIFTLLTVRTPAAISTTNDNDWATRMFFFSLMILHILY